MDPLKKESGRWHRITRRFRSEKITSAEVEKRKNRNSGKAIGNPAASKEGALPVPPPKSDSITAESTTANGVLGKLPGTLEGPSVASESLPPAAHESLHADHSSSPRRAGAGGQYVDATIAMPMHSQEPEVPPFQAFLRQPTGDFGSAQGNLLRNISAPIPSSFKPNSTTRALDEPDRAVADHPLQVVDSHSRRSSLSHHTRTINIDPGLPEPSTAWGSEFEDEEDWSALLEIRCELEVSLNDLNPVLVPENSDELDQEELNIRWYDASAWERLDKRAGEWLVGKSVRRDQPWDFAVLRHGSFRVIGKNHESLPRKLFDRKQLPEVLVGAVTRFISEHLGEPFHLRVRWDYESIQIAPRAGESYDTTIRNELSRKEKKNFKDQIFFSTQVLNHILPEDAAKKIIEQDNSLDWNDERLTQFQRRLRDCRRLQTLCIWQRLSMSVLKGILDANPELDDIKLKNLTSLTEISNGDLAEDTKDWKDFKKSIPAFRPYQFPSTANFKKSETIDISLEEGVDIPDDVVVPICHEGDEETLIGEGGFSRVLAVKIEPSYQWYTQVCLRPRVTQ